MKKTSADSDYFLKFHLDSDPFPVGNRDPVLFLTPLIERRLAKIVELIDTTESFVIVTAPAGAGKTTLFRHLPSLRKDHWVVSSINADAKLGPERFADTLLQGVAPPEGDQTTRAITRLHKFLEQCDHHKVKPVFIIDNAHTLPTGSLDLLMDLSGLRYNRTMFHFVLFADDRMLELIEDIGVTGESAVNLRNLPLPPLSPQDTFDYIQHRLTACGLVAPSPFDEAGIEHMQAVSGGLPAGINLLAREKLLAMAVDSKGGGRGRLLAAAVLVIGAGAWWFLGTGDIPPVAPAPVAVQVPAPESPALAGDDDEGSEETTDTVDAVPAPPAEEMLALETTKDEPDVAMVHTAAVRPAEQPKAETVAADAPLSGPAAIAENAVAAETMAESPADAADEAVTSPAAAPVAVVDEPGPVTEVWSYSTVTAPAAPGDATTWRTGLRGPDWIRQQPDGTWFLQLVNASQLVNAEKLLRDLDHVLEKLSGYTNYTPSGQFRYLVMYGAYPDRDSAVAAVGSIDPAVQAINPWPRSRSSILKDMDAALARGLAP